MSSLEKLSYDLIDDEFFMIFKPVYITKCILGSTRFNIKDKFISAPTIKQKILTVLMIAMSSWAGYFTFTSKAYDVFLSGKSSLYLLNLGILQFFLTYMLYLAVMIPNAFFNRNQNIVLFIQLRNIDRYLKLDKYKGSYKNQFNKTFVVIMAIILFHVIWFIWYIIFHKTTKEFLFIGVGFIAFIVIEIEMIDFGNILQFLILRLTYINKLLKEKVEFKWRNLIKTSASDVKSKEVSVNFFKAFEGVILAYDMLQTLYGIYVSIFF